MEEKLNQSKSLNIPFPVYLLIGLFVSCLIISILLGSKLILIGGLTLSVGVFVLPVTFLVTDIISEVYGKKMAFEVVKVGLMMQLVALFFIILGGDIFPPAPRRDISEAYNSMFSLAPRMILASMIAYIVSQVLDVYIFHRLREITFKKHLWFRNNVSTMGSQLIDTMIFMHIFLGGILPEIELLKSALAVYLAKVVIAFFDTPLVYLGRYLIMNSRSYRNFLILTKT